MLALASTLTMLYQHFDRFLISKPSRIHERGVTLVRGNGTSDGSSGPLQPVTSEILGKISAKSGTAAATAIRRSFVNY